MQQEKKELYQTLKKSGELYLFFEGMTGTWKKDKELFCHNYDEVMESLKSNDNITNDFRTT